jgi:hypothetical protein
MDSPGYGNHVYRGVSMDFDGLSQATGLKSVILEPDFVQGEVYPNPAIDGLFTVKVNNPMYSGLMVAVYGLDGRTLWSSSFEAFQGLKSHVLDLSFLSSGTYFFVVQDDYKRRYAQKITRL